MEDVVIYQDNAKINEKRLNNAIEDTDFNQATTSKVFFIRSLSNYSKIMIVSLLYQQNYHFIVFFSSVVTL